MRKEPSCQQVFLTYQLHAIRIPQLTAQNRERAGGPPLSVLPLTSSLAARALRQVGWTQAPTDPVDGGD